MKSPVLISPPDPVPVNRSTPFIPPNGLRLGVCCLFRRAGL